MAQNVADLSVLVVGGKRVHRVVQRGAEEHEGVHDDGVVDHVHADVASDEDFFADFDACGLFLEEVDQGEEVVLEGLRLSESGWKRTYHDKQCLKVLDVVDYVFDYIF